MSDETYRPEDDVWLWLKCLVCFLLSPLLIPFLLIGVLVYVPMAIVGQIARSKRERKFKREHTEASRFLHNDDLKARLAAGSGTLIVIHQGPKGPIHEWWTIDEIIDAAPSPLPACTDECNSDELKAFAKSCVEKYTSDAGTAMLTNGVYTIVDSTVAAAFPFAKVVTIFNWFPGAPLIARGHFADEFRNAA